MHEMHGDVDTYGALKRRAKCGAKKTCIRSYAASRTSLGSGFFNLKIFIFIYLIAIGRFVEERFVRLSVRNSA
jgi:hypothetical protein